MIHNILSVRTDGYRPYSDAYLFSFDDETLEILSVELLVITNYTIAPNLKSFPVLKINDNKIDVINYPNPNQSYEYKRIIDLPKETIKIIEFDAEKNGCQYHIVDYVNDTFLHHLYCKL